MNYTIIKKLPSMETITQMLPLSTEGYQQILRDKQEVRAIIEGQDTRLIIIVGPCSAWPKAAVLEYARRLVKLRNQLQDKLKIIMRVYIQKPRTTKGWTGPINQPDPLKPSDIEAGIYYTREMMVKVIEMGLPIADEALFTHNAKVFQELLAWVAIGARSSEDQEHRIFASALDCPVGLKNPTHGSLAIGVNSIVAAQHPHVAVFDGFEVQTPGNKHAHLILRGGQKTPNYSIDHLDEVKQYMDAHNIINPAVLIDASHDNCIINGRKDHRRQAPIIFEVLKTLQSRPDLKQLVKGFMIESFLKDGHQDLTTMSAIDYEGLSITDPCLSWEQTESLLLNLAEQVTSS